MFCLFCVAALFWHTVAGRLPFQAACLREENAAWLMSFFKYARGMTNEKNELEMHKNMTFFALTNDFFGRIMYLCFWRSIEGGDALVGL